MIDDSEGSILDQILATKRDEVAAIDRKRRERLIGIAASSPPARPFRAALVRAPGEPIRAIAEVKRASPSAGAIRAGADPVAIAREYEAAGAAAISVLTDQRYFDGDLTFLAPVHADVSVPILRKDFIIAPIQIAEARAAAADAVLLIAAAFPFDGVTLDQCMRAAANFGLDALVEVHSEAELDAALAVDATLVGVNHRDLRTFAIDMSLTARIAARVPPHVVLVAESGIRTPADVRRLADAGAHAILVGEQLMRAPSPGAALRELLA